MKNDSQDSLKIQSNSENIYFEISNYLQKLIISERKSCSIHNFVKKLTASIITTTKKSDIVKKINKLRVAISCIFNLCIT